MNTATTEAPVTATRAQRSYPRVCQMQPGRLFVRPHDPDRVYALLSHSQMDVRETSQIWVVVIAGAANCSTVPGEITALPRDAEVQPLRVVGAMQLAPV